MQIPLVFAVEFVTFAIKFILFAVEFITLALEFIPFTQEFVMVTLTAINQSLITRWVIFAKEDTTSGTPDEVILQDPARLCQKSSYSCRKIL